MFVIMTYDVDSARVAKALKAARRYLTHVQNSVFEGGLSEGQLQALKEELLRVIDPEHDNVRFYVVSSERFLSTSDLGAKKRSTGNII